MSDYLGDGTHYKAKMADSIEKRLRGLVLKATQVGGSFESVTTTITAADAKALIDLIEAMRRGRSALRAVSESPDIPCTMTGSVAGGAEVIPDGANFRNESV